MDSGKAMVCLLCGVAVAGAVLGATNYIDCMLGDYTNHDGSAELVSATLNAGTAMFFR